MGTITRLMAVSAAALVVSTAPTITLASDVPAPIALPAMVRYDDPAGDGAGPGPDVLSVTLTRAGPGVVDVAVRFAADPPLTWNEDEGWAEVLGIRIGTDPAGVPIVPAQGPAPEYATGVHAYDAQIGHSPVLARLNPGPGEDRFTWGAVQASTDGPTVTVTLHADALGDPATVYLSVVAGRELEAGGGTNVDQAPDQAEDATAIVSMRWDFTSAVPAPSPGS